MDVANKGLYKALNVGMFIFVEDEFMFNDVEDEIKAQVLMDFARMDEADRKLLLELFPNNAEGKKELEEYANRANHWILGVDWKSTPRDDVERVLKGHEDLLNSYQAVPETLWMGEYKNLFLRYGVGVPIQNMLNPLFAEVIRASVSYLPTRIYQTYTEEVRKSLMHDLKICKERGKSAILILDNMVGQDRMAAQMVKDLKERNEKDCCPIYCTILSTASIESEAEHCQTSDLYIGYANKEDGLDGVHRNITKAAINALIQQYKTKYKKVVEQNCNTLAENPDLVEYLYEMAKAEGEPGYELLQQWVSFMASYDMEQSEEMLQLMKLSACLERCKPELNCDLDVPEKLTRAAHSENFSSTVNRYYTMTAPGDIFEYEGKLYILVGQDCDYMMGEERDRNSPLCEFVPAEIVPQGKIEKMDNDKRYVYINNYVDDSENICVLKVDYGKRKVVCNEVINLCAFNVDGECKVNYDKSLAEEAASLMQPYMVAYYDKLTKYFKQVKEIREAHPDFFSSVSDLKTVKPLIDISEYEEDGSVLDYKIKRVSRLKKTPALYLYKMFLEYRGRMPYISINLTGYSMVSTAVRYSKKEYMTTVYVKLTNSRKYNMGNQARLAWYVKKDDLQSAIKELVDSKITLKYSDTYIKLDKADKIPISCKKGTIFLKKAVKQDVYTIEIVKWDEEKILCDV